MVSATGIIFSKIVFKYKWISGIDSEIWNQNNNKIKYNKYSEIASNQTGWWICDNKWYNIDNIL